MEVKREKSISLYFLRFLAKTITLVIAVSILFFGVFLILVNTNAIIPANQTEIEVTNFKNICKKNGNINLSLIPSNTDYLLFDKNGNKVSTNMQQNESGVADNLFKSNEDSQFDSFRNIRYLKIQENEQTLVISYKICSSFNNKFLANIFPSSDITLIVIYVILIILTIVFSILSTGNDINKDFIMLEKTANEIRDHNLDFNVKPTKIKEFNKVLSALDELKINLSSTLKREWELEQQQKADMSALAHDIKTPLTVIKGNSELLIENDLSEDNLSLANSIKNNSSQIEYYVNKIIEISKDQSSVETSQNINTYEFLNEVILNANELSKLSSIKIEVLKTDLPENINSDKEALIRVYSNVFSNAIRYSQKNSVITFENKTVEHNGKKYLMSEIIDSGKGFSKEALKHAKEKFFQDDKARTSNEHFGMGLFICNNIIKNLGGTLTLSNTETGGKVTVEIPLE